MYTKLLLVSTKEFMGDGMRNAIKGFLDLLPVKTAITACITCRFVVRKAALKRAALTHYICYVYTKL